MVTVYVENGLNQPVSVQVLGSMSNPPVSTIAIGSTFVVNQNSADFRTLIPEQAGWVPYLTVSLYSSVAPTTGSVRVFLVRSDNTIEVIAGNFPIRDTVVHTYLTDPSNISVVPW
jgi:hypothetical protein